MAQYLFLLTDGQTETLAASPWIMIVVYIAFFGLLWFILIRPQRKRQKEVQQMQHQVKVGDSVLTTGGLYGKIVDINEHSDLLIIEFGTNKSVRIPVQREAVASIKEPVLTAPKETTEE